MKYSILDRRITIEQQNPAQDESGQPVTTWETFATVWAEMIDYKGNENEQAGQVTSQNNCEFRIRYRAGINATMRVSYNGNYFNIVSTLEEGRKDYLVLRTTLRDNVSNF